MGESYGAVASAVVVPEPPQASSPSTSSVAAESQPAGSKRKQSLDASSDENGKRPRLNIDPNASTNGDSAPTSSQEPSSHPPETPSGSTPTTVKSSRARVAAPDEERRRNKRLFGGLLSALSQPNRAGRRTNGSGIEGRRADINRKQQEKLVKQAEEANEEEKRRLEDLTEARRREQKVWDEESLRVRHRCERAVAGFFKTNAEPILYYKPWDLRTDEKARIQVQIDETEDRIDREVNGFEELRRQEKGASEDNVQPDHSIGKESSPPKQEHDDEAVHAGKPEADSEGKKSEMAQEVPVDDKESTTSPVHHETIQPNEVMQDRKAHDNRDDEPAQQNVDPSTTAKDKEEDGDEMEVEAGEDAVIY